MDYSGKSKPVQFSKHLLAEAESDMDISQQAADETEWASSIQSDSLSQLSLIRRRHQEAKAVKADDAGVPVHL